MAIVSRKQSAGKPAQSLESLIAKQIRKQKVAKYSNIVVSDEIFASTGTAWAASNVTVMSPSSTSNSIVQGTGEGDRVGNRIIVKNFEMKFILYPNPYNVTTNPTPIPVEVDIWIFSQRGSNVTPTLASLGNFFQNGDSTTGPTGGIGDLLKTPNTDAYIIYKHIVGKLGVQAFVATPGNVGSQGYYANNDFEYNIRRTVNLTHALPSHIEYDDTTTLPKSRAVFMFSQVINADGSAQAAGTLPAVFAFELNLTFADV